MMQRLILTLIRVITSTFFRRIDVVGEHHIPADGPVIFAGNHPNALMDGWLLIAKCGRWPLHFLANAKLWEYRVLGPMLDATGAVPVYRHEEHDGKVDTEVRSSGSMRLLSPAIVSESSRKALVIRNRSL